VIRHRSRHSADTGAATMNEDKNKEADDRAAAIMETALKGMK
jgi:hypothetical protein